MKKQALSCFALLLMLMLSVSCTTQSEKSDNLTSDQHMYDATWESLKKHDTPQWLRDGKFGTCSHKVFVENSRSGKVTGNILII